MINGTLVNNGGNAANRFVVPNQTSLSMLLKRLQGNGVQRMPPLATSERDLDAEALVSSWITQDLPVRQSFDEWRTARFGASPGPNSGPTEDWDGDGLNNLLEYLRSTDPKLPSQPLSLSLGLSAGNFQMSFPLIPNRALVIETSLNLQDWSLWNAPGNIPDYPAASQTRTLVAPADTAKRFFRARITAP